MIDWDRVGELKEEVGADAFGEVVEIFLDEMDEAIAALPDQNGADALSEALHFLKGSALNIGFSGLAALCVAGEETCRAGQADTVNTHDIADGYADARKVFLQGLADDLAA